MASCESWLQQLQLTNLHQAHSKLRFQIDVFNRFSMHGLERLHTLELLRETVVAIQVDYAKKLISKKLPLEGEELSVFASIGKMWKCMVAGYQQCIHSFLSGDKQLNDSIALITQRCLRYTGLQLVEHLSNGYEFDPELWRQMHELFSFAEKENFIHKSISDEIHSPDSKCSCHSVWLQTLLISHAYTPELTRSQLQLIYRWLSQWCNVIEISHRFVISEGDAPPLAVDISSIQGVQLIKLVTHPGNLRYLAMVPMSKLLRVKTILMQQGQTSQQVGLGESNRGDCIYLLQTLHKNLCEEKIGRRIERHNTAKGADLCFTLTGICLHISDKSPRRHMLEIGADHFEQNKNIIPTNDLTESHRLKIDAEYKRPLEYWKVENESALGAKVLRENCHGEPIGVNQIVAIRPHNTSVYILGKVCWILVTLSGNLRMGIEYFPGLPQTITFQNKNTDTTLTNNKEAGLLLPAVPTLNSPSSLFLPRNFFLPNQLTEYFDEDDKCHSIKFGFSVAKGRDFERVSFSPV